MIIYEIRNTVNGKSYVGQTTQPLPTRLSRHTQLLKNNQHHSPHLQHAWNRYGADAFECRELERLDDVSDLDWYEGVYIALYGSAHRSKGYNIAHGGNHCSPTADTRKKLSAANMGKPKSPEMKERIAKTMKGRPSPLRGRTLSAETRAKLSEAKKAYVFTAEHRQNMGAARKGKKLSAEICANRSAASSKRTVTGFVSPDGVIYAPVVGLRPFCKTHNLSCSSMRLVVSGDRDNHKGWRLYDIP